LTSADTSSSDGRGRPEDKITNGVYVRSFATAIASSRLTDASQDWEQDRWQSYFVKYAADLPPARITGNSATELFGEFEPVAPGEYTIYAKWTYVPATPLNVACYDPNAMNEVYNNTFVALTEYRTTRHGGYGDSGQWASAVYFVGMQKGPAAPGKYAISIHQNRFISNDLFVSSSRPVTMTIRMENNTFTLASEPEPTAGHTLFRRIGAPLEAVLKGGGNSFQGMRPQAATP